MIWLMFKRGHWRLLYLWVKYKYILKKDIIGFYNGVPVIRSKYLRPESDIPTIIVDEPWTDEPAFLKIDDESIVARMKKRDRANRGSS